jgi:ABC-2 type transport system permease protein
MKSYWAIFKKEFFHILRDRRTLFILILLPVTLVLIFGYAITNEFKDSKIGVLDESKSVLSKQLIDHVTSSEHFIIKEYLNSVDEIDFIFKKGEIKMVLVVPPDFENDFEKTKDAKLQLIIDGTEPNFANTVNQYASIMINRFAIMKGGVRTKAPYQIEVETRMIFNPELASAYNFLPGVISLILLLISAMMTSLTIAKEKETGTMEILLVSPIHPLTIILGKVGPYAILSFINTLVILLMGYYIFDVPIRGSLPLLLGMCLLYLITSLSLGVLISTKTSTQQAAMLGSLMSLMMPSMLLSGFIFPISSMPVLLQYISKIIPATYFTVIIKGVMLKGADFSYIWYPASVLGMMTLLFLVISLLSFKTRLE